MSTIARRAAAFLRLEDGPTSTEYAVMLALVIVGCIGAIGVFTGVVGGLYATVRDAVPWG